MQHNCQLGLIVITLIPNRKMQRPAKGWGEGGALCIFQVWGCAIRKGINFPDIGIKNNINNVHNFGIGTSCRSMALFPPDIMLCTPSKRDQDVID